MKDSNTPRMIPDVRRKPNCPCGRVSEPTCHRSYRTGKARDFWFCREHRPGPRTNVQVHDRQISRRRMERALERAAR